MALYKFRIIIIIIIDINYPGDMIWTFPPLKSIPFLPTFTPTPTSTEWQNWIGLYYDTFIEQRTVHYVY